MSQSETFCKCDRAGNNKLMTATLSGSICARVKIIDLWHKFLSDRETAD
ncbi:MULTISPECIES: hypothetical protein [unclassified Microcoleus]